MSDIIKNKTEKHTYEFKQDPSTLPYAGVRKTSEYDSPSYIFLRDRMFDSKKRPFTRRDKLRYRSVEKITPK